MRPPLGMRSTTWTEDPPHRENDTQLPGLLARGRVLPFGDEAQVRVYLGAALNQGVKHTVQPPDPGRQLIRRTTSALLSTTRPAQAKPQWHRCLLPSDTGGLSASPQRQLHF